MSLFIFSCSYHKKPAIDNKEKKTEQWKMVWHEEFDGNTLDAKRWSRISRGTSDWNNYMSKADTCYLLRNGKLILKGFKNTFLPEDTAKYLTGGVTTKGKVSFMNGKISIKAKLNPATGAWPAFWMLPNEGKWPLGGEIDIMERLNFDNFVYQTVHSHYTVNLGIKNNPPHSGTQYINPNDFNTYSVEMYDDRLVFKVNENQTFTYPKIQTDKENQYPFNKEFYLLLDMQLGGNWVGNIRDEELPVEMEIDWVRFYKKVD